MDILYATEQVVACVIEQRRYYIQFGPDFPKIYDDTCKPLIVPNVDMWIQAKTHQRYDLRTLKDMTMAFIAGMRCAYSKSDVMKEAYNSCCITINEILTKGLIYDYTLVYWIEVLGNETIERYLKTIAEKLEYVMEKMGKDRLYNDLCRIYRICVIRQIDSKDVCENLIKRLGSVVREPKFPDSRKIDQIIMNNVKTKVFEHVNNMYKNVDDELIKVLKSIETGRQEDSQ